MTHPTSIWAASYGLPDPGVPAGAVLDARPDQLGALASHGRAVAEAARQCAESTDRVAAAVHAAWSAALPELAVLALGRSARTVADICAGIAGAVRSFAAAVHGYQLGINQAYAQADAAIADGRLLSDIAPYPPDRMLRLVRERCALVQQLYAAVSAIADEFDDAALQLAGRIDVDPRDCLPDPAVGHAAPAAAGAATTDRRNRARLAADLASSSPYRRQFAASIRDALARAGATGPVQLLDYDPTSPPGQGGVAIALGAVDDAGSVAVLVPGVGNSPSDLSGTLDVAATLVSATSAAAPGTDTAAVVWLGYDAPLSWPHDPKPPAGPAMIWHIVGDSVTAINGAEATVGGVQLAGFCRQLRGMMDASAALTLIGHSYGSTVVSQAATRLAPDADVDDIVLLAPPGAGFGPTSADDYSAVPADHVYALAFPADPVPSPALDVLAGVLAPFTVTPGGPYGVDPGSARFGAQLVDVPSGVSVLHRPNWLTTLATGGPGAALGPAGADPLNNLNQHALTNYLGGAALAAVAAIAVGRYAEVPVRERR